MKTYTSFHPAKGKKLGSLLLVHGAGEHIGRYSWAIEQWNLAGYDVLGGDLPGYGRSGGKKGHIDYFEQYIEAVDEWYDEIVKRAEGVPYLFGHSLGGLVVARFMERRKRKVLGIILSSPCFGLRVKVPVWKETIARTLNVLCPSLVLRSEIKPHLVTRNQKIIEQDRMDPHLTQGVSVRWYRELILNIKLNWIEIGQFPPFPLLIHQGGEDRVTDKVEAKKWFKALPYKEKVYHEWPGLYHEILNEPERDQVMGEMIAWMKKTSNPN